MGALCAPCRSNRISKDPVEVAKPFPLPKPPSKGAAWPKPVDDPCEIQTISQSRFYCMVQQSIVWPDYFAIRDQRGTVPFQKNHVVNAKDLAQADEDFEWAWELMVLVYGHDHTDPSVKALVDKLMALPGPPRGIYVLEGKYTNFLKRYPALDHRSDLADSLPGPVELVPPTSEHPGTYAIHRLHFLRAKQIIARLWCTVIINVSSRRLFVKSKGLTLENTSFEDEPSPDDQVVQLYMKYAAVKPKHAGRHNIIIIDEGGCNYGTILAGWHLIKHRNIPLDLVNDSLNQRAGFLDPWYLEVLQGWVNP